MRTDKIEKDEIPNNEEDLIITTKEKKIKATKKKIKVDLGVQKTVYFSKEEIEILTQISLEEEFSFNKLIRKAVLQHYDLKSKLK